jgi:uncharacterized membrane-anchored protein YjiN (DUF445 family)
VDRQPETLTSADAARQAGLRRMKATATGLFVLVTVIFLLARWGEETNDWLGYVRAFAEAAMVGALADWFAVTALFRHPLGLPIPHTAIIPNRKDQIGESLGEFVQTNFLTREVLGERLAGAHAGQRLGDWLAETENAARAGGAVADALRGTLQVIDDRDVSDGLERLVARRVQSVPVAPLVSRAIALAMEGGHQERLLDSVLVGVSGFLNDSRPTLRERLQHESPWWVPEPIDNRIFDKIFAGVQSFLHDVHDDPEHEVRASINERLAAFAERLRDDPELLKRGEELKDEVLEHPEVRAWLGRLWGDLKRTTLHATMHPDSELRQRIDSSLVELGRRLQTDPELQAKVDEWLAGTVGYLVDHYRGEVAELISSTVAKWDGQATSRRLELQVGRDLQFIRINGTLVGGLAGLVIYTVSRALF